MSDYRDTVEAVYAAAAAVAEPKLCLRDLPSGVCDKTAAALAALARPDIILTPSPWHYAGDGCC